MKQLTYLFTGLFILSFFLTCSDSGTSSKSDFGKISGVVYQLPANTPINKEVFFFLNNTLVQHSRDQGQYIIDSVTTGTHQLLCSIVNYRDTVISVKVTSSETTVQDFYLNNDSRSGRLYGEFQDVTLYEEQLLSNPSLANYNSKEIFDGISGATLQAKYLQYEVPPREVFLGDSLVATSDGFGQYWVNLPNGTYPFTATCQGYKSITTQFKIYPDSIQYLNFFLERDE